MQIRILCKCGHRPIQPILTPSRCDSCIDTHWSVYGFYRCSRCKLLVLACTTEGVGPVSEWERYIVDTYRRDFVGDGD